MRIAAAALAAWIGGCAVAPPEEVGTDVEDAPAAEAEAPATKETGGEAERQASPPARGRGGAGGAREVLVPRDALWLVEPIAAHYTAMPAAAAIREIAQGRPIRLTFDADGEEMVAVSAPPGAVTIQDHLDAVCSQADWTYTVSRGTVLVYDMETRQFALAQQPGRSAARMVLRGLAQQGAGEGGGANTVEVGLDPYTDEVIALVRGIVGDPEDDTADPRTRVAMLPSANAVLVTAKPHLMRRVERQLARYNVATAKMVRLELTMYEVDVTGTEDRSLDLTALRSAAIGVGIVLAPETDARGGGELRVSFDEGNRHDGSRAVLEWLRTAGKTTIAFEDALEVRNNAVASVDATETRQYLARISREKQVAGATQLETPTVEFGELRLGWAVHVQPTIAGDRVNVRLGLSRSALVDEVPYSFDNGAIEGTTFATDDYNRVMSVSLRDGETKLLTMLASATSRVAKRRAPWLPWLAGGVSRAKRERETVLLMTARIL